MFLFGRYVLRQYLKVLLLSLTFFIALMIISRLEEISRFATLGAPLSYIALFTLYQIPYIIPLALPLSSLLASTLLFQQLSTTRELTALRAGGVSLLQTATPLVCVSACICLVNFYMVSEVATTAHLTTRKMMYEFTKKNPLVLLKKAKSSHLKQAYVHMDRLEDREAAHNVLLALPNDSTKRLALYLAKRVFLEEDQLKGEETSLIAPLPLSGKDSVLIENQEESTMSAPELMSLLNTQGWKASNDRLTLSLLRARIFCLGHASEPGAIPQISRCYSEIVRRVALAFAPLTLTVVGMAYGIEMSRTRTKRRILALIVLTVTMLVAFLIGKELDYNFPLATLLFVLPHALLVYFSWCRLLRINRGLV